MLHTDFRILEAEDGAQALEMLQQQGTGISLCAAGYYHAGAGWVWAYELYGKGAYH